ncbi:hypothetical protein ACROYT_G015116 [Oculina patagonica]
MYNAHHSDSEGKSADDIITMVTTCDTKGHHSLRNLDEQDYQLIMSPHGWLDGATIHSTQLVMKDMPEPLRKVLEDKAIPVVLESDSVCSQTVLNINQP